jgi:anti-sigma regulatory factor (Ser/Thr protein kinase)
MYRIVARPDGPARARQIVERELASALPVAVVQDVKLMVSELVTNSICHGCTTPGGVVTLEIVVNGKLRCTVLDRGPGRVSGQAGPTDGWGLRSVEQLASRWGFTRSREGTRVWFETAVGKHSRATLTAAKA